MAEKSLTSNYSSDWIARLESRQHWLDYWHQQKILEGRIAQADRILEIGVGSGFSANYLRSKGFQVTTLDVDAEKEPDLLFNIALDDFSRIGPADAAMAFEVLEHVPYDRALAALGALKLLGVTRLFVSLPLNQTRLLELAVRIRNRVCFRLAFNRKLHRITSRHHFWELEYGAYGVQRFVSDVRGLGFFLEASHSNEETQHRFFYFRLAAGSEKTLKKGRDAQN